MQGFNRYFPPDFDPKVHDTLNNYHGKHALGDRARKIDKGILITRFELPFNIWCGSCEAHIGMGVRYNAEKKKVGMYHSTPIYSFRCKCHLCGNWFEIRTDPQNTRYVVESGARQKQEEWDETENGGIVLNQGKEDGKPIDAFAEVEKKTNDKLAALATKDRLEELMEFSETRNSDPFTLSQKLRKTFRKEKAELINKSYQDDEIRTKYSLPVGLRLIDSNEDQHGCEEEEIKEASRKISKYKMQKEVKRSRLNGKLLGLTHQQALLPPKAAQLANLKDQLISSRRRRTTPSSVKLGSVTTSRRPIRNHDANFKPLPTTSLSSSKKNKNLNPTSSSTSTSSQKPLAILNSYSSD